MDDMHSVLTFLSQSARTSIVSIRSSDRKYLRSMFQGRLYKYLALHNGLPCGPKKFIKLLKPALPSLRKGDATIAA